MKEKIIKSFNTFTFDMITNTFNQIELNDEKK